MRSPFSEADSECLICVIWLIHMCDMSRSYAIFILALFIKRWGLPLARQIQSVLFVWYDSYICVTCLVPWRALFVCNRILVLFVKRWGLALERQIQSVLFVWYDSFICVTCLVCMKSDSCSLYKEMRCPFKKIKSECLIGVIWLIHTCDVSRSYVWHDTFKSVAWCIYMCDITCSYV